MLGQLFDPQATGIEDDGSQVRGERARREVRGG